MRSSVSSQRCVRAMAGLVALFVSPHAFAEPIQFDATYVTVFKDSDKLSTGDGSYDGTYILDRDFGDGTSSSFVDLVIGALEDFDRISVAVFDLDALNAAITSQFGRGASIADADLQFSASGALRATR